MITIQNYVRAQSLEEAWQLNQNKRNRILGGMLWLRLGKGSVNTAIDLCDLGLGTIEETEDAFSIGAMATLRDIELHEGLHTYSGGATGTMHGSDFRNTDPAAACVDSARWQLAILYLLLKDLKVAKKH